MRFETTFSTDKIPNGTLIYRADEYSFDVVPPPNGFTSILINDLNLEIDMDRRVVSVWGFCPYPNWKSTKLTPPSARFGGAIFVFDGALRGGVSIRLNEERWPVFVDVSSGWVYVNRESKPAYAVKILVGAMLEFDDDHRLCGIWLRPEGLPKLA